MKKNSIFLILFLVFFALIFREWFSLGIISSGDFNYYYGPSLKEYMFFPFAWDWQQHFGLGAFSSPFAWIYYDFVTPVIIGRLFSLDWHAISEIFYFSPFLIITFYSSIYLFKKIFDQSSFYLLAAFIYLFNTYILMMVGGGQIVGISLAYAIFPFVLAQFIELINVQNLKSISQSIKTGLFITLLIFFDLRFAYILVVAVFLYFSLVIKQSWQKSVAIFVIPFGIAGLLHAFWILPILMTHQNPVDSLGGAYKSLSSVTYFSFAKFENAIGLLHPNWPENVFGKVNFMKSEFLILPILAFSSVLFIDKKNKTEARDVLYFAFLGLFGIFLAKGTNDPFGFIYLWLFQQVPGFIMFRDPTKWYTFIAIAYSVLIPFTVWKVYELLKKLREISFFNLKFFVNSKNAVFNLQNLFMVFFVFFWLFTVRQAVFGQLGGTFKSTVVPSEYISFENFLSNQSQFSRTLWVPTTQRFGFSSQNHPAISSEEFFTVYDEPSLIKKLNQPGTEKLLQESGVKYIVIPTDSQKEIFLKDNLYSAKLYKQTVLAVSKIQWLKKLKQFNNLVIFEVQNPQDHFWIFVKNNLLKNESFSYKKINPVLYSVSVKNVKKGDLLVFSEGFDQHWVIVDESKRIHKESSLPYDKRFNSFVLPQDGSYTFDIYYTPQKWINIGIVISLISLGFVCISFIIIIMSSKKKKI